MDVIRSECRGKRVLHLGCTNYPYTEDSIKKGMLLHSELQSIATDLWGIDSDQAGLDILASHGTRQLIRGDLEKLHELDITQEFDVILAGEMIEHLNNPGQFLQGVKRFMNGGSVLLLTTINAYCGMRFLWYGLRGRRGRVEFVHPDHVAYYSYSTLEVLVNRHGMQVEKFLFYDIGREHRPHNKWYLNAANDFFVRLAPQWADGVIMICRLSD